MVGGLLEEAFDLSHHVHARERRTRVNYVHETSSAVEVGTYAWPDSVSVHIVLFSDLVVGGPVGYDTGQLL